MGYGKVNTESDLKSSLMGHLMMRPSSPHESRYGSPCGRSSVSFSSKWHDGERWHSDLEAEEFEVIDFLRVTLQLGDQLAGCDIEYLQKSMNHAYRLSASKLPLARTSQVP